MIWHWINDHFIGKQTKFFHKYAILLDSDIFRKSYVIVQEIPSSLSKFFPFSDSATQSAGIMSAVEELFFGASEGSA